MKNPYKSLPDFCFWSRSMAGVAPWQVDTVTKSKIIGPNEKVATIGSCFAQHLSRHISSVGLNYFVAEQPPEGMSAEEAKRKNYNVFSARYGNLYTVRQSLQLFERAFGTFKPQESIWTKGDKYVDAFRPQIEPGGFKSVPDVKSSMEEHLSCVREIFLKSDWIVFTLGLSEAWRAKKDGAVYPTAPGVVGEINDPELYEFVNFTAEEIRLDLFELIESVTKINPKVKFLLTVSPVPLIATYEKRQVWVSTTYSKAALRVATDEAERAFENVIYFPSYEIITSPAAGNTYFADDLRDILDIGVQHVMRVFSANFIDMPKTKTKAGSLRDSPSRSIKLKTDIICDEEILDK